MISRWASTVSGPAIHPSKSGSLIIITVKISPKVMFITQIWGTVFGGFINYVVMVSIVTGNADVLANGNGNNSWSGATMQAYNTNAAAWALAKYLYKIPGDYYMV